MAEQQSSEERDFKTRALHVGQDASQWKSRAVVPPIVMATTFAQFEPAVTAVISHKMFLIWHLFNFKRCRDLNMAVVEIRLGTRLNCAWLR